MFEKAKFTFVLDLSDDMDDKIYIYMISTNLHFIHIIVQKNHLVNIFSSTSQ